MRYVTPCGNLGRTKFNGISFTNDYKTGSDRVSITSFNFRPPKKKGGVSIYFSFIRLYFQDYVFSSLPRITFIIILHLYDNPNRCYIYP